MRGVSLLVNVRCELESAERVNAAAQRVVSRRITLLVLIGFVGLCAVSDASAQRATGDDSGEVVLSPEHDLQRQLDSHPPGTRFRLTAGTYRLSAPLVPQSNQTLAGGADVVLSGARPLTGFVREGSAWFVDNQTQQGTVLGEGSVCLPASPRCARPEDLFLDDVMLRHAADRADLRPGSWYFDYARNRIYIADNPSGHRIETSVTPFAVGGYAERVTLRGFVVEKFATPTHEAAVNGLGRGWTIEGLEVRLNHFAGIRTVDAAVARGNNVHHNGSLGFIGAGDNVIIEENEIAYNNTAGYDPYWGAGGAKWVLTTRLLVRGNYSHDNHGHGLWTDIDNIDVVFESNRVEDNDLCGIFHEVGYRAIIRDNVVSRNGRARPYPGWVDGAGILVLSSSDVEVSGNTVTDNWQGITALEGERGSGRHGPWVLARLHVHNNVIRQSGTAPVGSGRTGILQMHDRTSAFTSAGNRFERNTYHVGENKRPFLWMNRDVAEDEWRRYGQDVTGTIMR
jgi:hypothetical protein